jgi:hypothetical protein
MRDRAGADPALAARRLFLFCFVCLFVIGIRRPGSICFALFLWGLLIRVRERGRLNFSDGNSDLLPRARVISEVTFRNGARWIFAPVSAARTRSVAVAVRGGDAISLCLPNWMGGWGLGRELLPLQICLSFRHLQIRGEENSSSAQVLYASESDASLPLNSYGLTSYSSSSPANAAGSALERSVGRSLATCHGPGGTVAGVHGRLP